MYYRFYYNIFNFIYSDSGVLIMLISSPTVYFFNFRFNNMNKPIPKPNISSTFHHKDDRLLRLKRAQEARKKYLMKVKRNII